MQLKYDSRNFEKALRYAIDGDRSTYDYFYSSYDTNEVSELQIQVNLKEAFDIYQIRLYGTEVRDRIRDYPLSEIFARAWIGSSKSESSRVSCSVSQLSTTWFVQYKCDGSANGDTVTFVYPEGTYYNLAPFHFEIKEIEVYGSKAKKKLSGTSIAFIVIGVIAACLIMYLSWTHSSKKRQRAREIRENQDAALAQRIDQNRARDRFQAEVRDRAQAEVRERAQVEARDRARDRALDRAQVEDRVTVRDMTS
jgi:hypothetical protein